MSKKKIMIVDDYQDIRYVIRQALEDSYDFIEAKNGQECLNLLKKGEKPDLFIMDIMMPELDGWDTVASIRATKTFKNTPIVFLTAKEDDSSKGLGKLTAVDYIVKPFKTEQLKQTIVGALNG